MAGSAVRRDALDVWRCGVDAVASDRLVRETLRLDETGLRAGPIALAPEAFDRIVVVGAGKAGAGMAVEVERLAEAAGLTERLDGWVNVPADCLCPTRRIHLHPARPAGVNEPTAEGVAGSEAILARLADLGPRDVCLALISGGGSALLPAPIPGISLDDKLEVTRRLAAAGASIHELNTVRKRLSRVKGGRLATACGAGWLIALIISDVAGDPLDIIASGPTVADSATPEDALAVLERFGGQARYPSRVIAALRQPPASPSASAQRDGPEIANLIIGSNATAVEAAAARAQALGYQVVLKTAGADEGEAADIGRWLAERLRQSSEQGPVALITGGEPVVTLPPSERRGRGGRNQQLALAALADLLKHPLEREFCFISGGTDGEDGPTDAAGGVVDNALVAACHAEAASLAEALNRADAYTFLQRHDALLKTGPTHTNVMDLRVALLAGNDGT